MLFIHIHLFHFHSFLFILSLIIITLLCMLPIFIRTLYYLFPIINYYLFPIINFLLIMLLFSLPTRCVSNLSFSYHNHFDLAVAFVVWQLILVVFNFSNGTFIVI